MYKTEYNDELPDNIEGDTIYILGENEHIWSLAMKCPCGCGDLVQLNLVPGSRPLWNINKKENGNISILPSIHRTRGCKSHYYVSDSKIQWC